MKKFACGLLALALMFSLTACNEPASSEDTPDGAGSQQTLRFAYVVKNQTNPFFISMAQGFEDACGDYGIECVVQATESEEEIDAQIQMCETLLTQNYDAIMVTPLSSSAIVPFVQSCNQAGVPIILVDTGADEEALDAIGAEVDFFSTSDNKQSGVLAAQALVDYLGNQGNIAILNGSAGASTTVAISEGFHEVLDGSGVTIAAEQAADWNRNIGYDVFTNIISANPDLDGVLCANDEMALGAVRAMEDVGMEGIPVFSINATQDGIDAVKNGTITGTVDKKPYEQGYIAVERALALLNGETLENTVEMLEPSMVDASNAE